MPEDIEYEEDDSWEEEAFLEGMEEADEEVERPRKDSLWPEEEEKLEEFQF